MENPEPYDGKDNPYRSQMSGFDFAEKSKILGIQTRNQCAVFEFFNRKIAFDGSDFIDIAGHTVTSAVKTVLCTYVLMCPEKVPEHSNRRVTFREFANAGPLFSSFTANTGKIIETTFSGRLEKLKNRSLKLGGTFIQTDGYDLSIRFQALPRIPIILNFNDADDGLPASAGFLYHDDAEVFLDLKSLGIICTYLTGFLIQGV